MPDLPKFATEAELVAAFCTTVDAHNANPNRDAQGWTAYHETAGWDLLLVGDRDGAQIGIEAKLSLNVKVMTQALPHSSYAEFGPDYRAVLVPRVGLQIGLGSIAKHIGLTVITLSGYATYRGAPQWTFGPALPD